MNVLVCGGRDFDDLAELTRVMNYIATHVAIDTLIEGGAKGADSLARQWAMSLGIHVATVGANWDYHGKSAGHKRNAAMLNLNPELVVAFPGGRGTQSMIKKAQDKNIRVIERK